MRNLSLGGVVRVPKALMPASVLAFMIAGGLTPQPARAQFFDWGNNGTWGWGAGSDWGDVGPGQIYRSLSDRGFRVVAPLRRNGAVFVADVMDRRGRRERLIVAAADGQILRRFLLNDGPMPRRGAPQPDDLDQQMERADRGEAPPVPPAGIPNVAGYGRDDGNADGDTTVEPVRPRPVPRITVRPPKPRYVERTPDGMQPDVLPMDPDAAQPLRLKVRPSLPAHPAPSAGAASDRPSAPPTVTASRPADPVAAPTPPPPRRRPHPPPPRRPLCRPPRPACAIPWRSRAATRGRRRRPSPAPRRPPNPRARSGRPRRRIPTCRGRRRPSPAMSRSLHWIDGRTGDGTARLSNRSGHDRGAAQPKREGLHADDQNIPDTHVSSSEREVMALKDLLLEARTSPDAGRVHASLVDTLDGLILHLGKQARIIEDLRSDLTHKQGIVTKIGGGDYRGEAASAKLREFAASSNGDRWFLGRDEPSGTPYVQHRANPPSGGAVTRIAVDAFLAQGKGSPENDALLHLLATLAE